MNYPVLNEELSRYLNTNKMAEYFTRNLIDLLIEDTKAAEGAVTKIEVPAAREEEKEKIEEEILDLSNLTSSPALKGGDSR